MDNTDNRQIYWIDCIQTKLYFQVEDGGTVRAVRTVQSVVGAKQDGIMGRKTLHAVNASDPKALFRTLHARRTAFLTSLAKGTQRKFLKGWLARVNAIEYGRLKY